MPSAVVSIWYTLHKPVGLLVWLTAISSVDVPSNTPVAGTTPSSSSVRKKRPVGQS